MITSETQAMRVQKKRAASGKRGFAKAVRRWCAGYYKYSGHDYYKNTLSKMPANW